MTSPLQVGWILDSPYFQQEFFVERAGRFDLVDGERIERQTSQSIQMKGCVQHVSEASAALFPEGTRIDDMIEVFTREKLIAPGGKIHEAEADTIVWRGRRYRVYAIKDWGENGYYKVFAEGYEK